MYISLHATLNDNQQYSDDTGLCNPKIQNTHIIHLFQQKSNTNYIQIKPSLEEKIFKKSKIVERGETTSACLRKKD